MKNTNSKAYWLFGSAAILIVFMALLVGNLPILSALTAQIKLAIFGTDTHDARIRSPAGLSKGADAPIKTTDNGYTSAILAVDARSVSNTLPALKDRYPLPHQHPIDKLVGMEIYQLEETHLKRIRALFDHQKLGDAYRSLLHSTQSGDADALWELSRILVLCDAPGWRGGQDAPRLNQCKDVPENSQAESLRLLALSAREGNLQARRSMLYFSAEPAGYSVFLAADPVLNGLVQQEILASLQFFTSIPAGGYLQRGYSIYSDGVVPVNTDLAAAYSIAAYTLQASRFPNAESTAHIGGINAAIFNALREPQRLNALAKAAEILKICCDGIPPATTFPKSTKP